MRRRENLLFEEFCENLIFHKPNVEEGEVHRLVKVGVTIFMEELL